jgi:hypothetical protein
MSRTSWRIAAAVGVVLVAAIVAGVAVLAGSGSGGGSVGTSSLTVGVERPPPPPRGALVLAGESGSRAVALAVGRRRLTATVLSPEGGPLSGLNVSFRVGSRVMPAQPCGNGCYGAAAASASRVEVRPSGSRPVVFRIPSTAPGAAAIVGRAGRAYRSLHTLVYLESLRSGPTGGVLTTWRLKAPNELQYTIRGGADSVVLGERRWDRDKPGAPWRRSQQIPALRVPLPAWGSVATNARLLGTGRVDGRPVFVVSFANPTTPAWFTAWIDRESYRTLRLRMTAAAHFMYHDYLEFNKPLRIVPPT